MKKDDEKKVPRKDYRLFTVYDIQVEEGFNPRQDFGDIDELARDISVNGVLVPLHGFIKKGDTKYTLTDGHRRFMAAQIVQKNNPDIELRIPLIAHKVMSEEQRLFNVLSFNGGKNLNPLEESDVVNRLINFGMNDKEIIKRTGMTSVYISNLKLLYSCPQKIKNLISSSVVTATLAMDVLRNSKSFEEAVEIIEKGVSFAAILLCVNVLNLLPRTKKLYDKIELSCTILLQKSSTEILQKKILKNFFMSVKIAFFSLN